jgi:kumamolisin
MAEIPSGYRRVEGTERFPIPGARRVGPANPQEALTVSVRVRKRVGSPALPGMREIAAGSRQAGRISRELFTAKFGASEADLELVSEFGRTNGLTVVESSAVRRILVLAGTVEQMNRAFAVELVQYESPRGSYRGREGPVHLPEDLVQVVEGVFGLDNRRMAVRTGGGGNALPVVTPREVAGLYNFPVEMGANGQTIALVEFGGGYRTDKHGTATDIEGYFNEVGLTAPALYPVEKYASNSPGHGLDDDAEVALDIEVAGAVAQGANLAIFFAPFTEQGWVEVITSAVLQTDLPAGWAAPSVISISWGWSELEAFGKFSWTEAAINTVDETFQAAAMLGVTVLVASGDNGSQCQIKDHKAHVTFPASDPWVTACGGTSMTSVNGQTFTEVTWNDNDVTGGGISDVFPVPYWQEPWNLPGSVNDGHKGRGIPDIAGYANGYTIFLDGKMQRGWEGTSEAAPLYAGLVALMNAAVGGSVGYLNPILYDLGGTSVFNDIADGGSNAMAGAPGYTAGPGWDACTGWGSVNGSALLNQVETCMFAMLLPTLL